MHFSLRDKEIKTNFGDLFITFNRIKNTFGNFPKMLHSVYPDIFARSIEKRTQSIAMREKQGEGGKERRKKAREHERNTRRRVRKSECHCRNLRTLTSSWLSSFFFLVAILRPPSLFFLIVLFLLSFLLTYVRELLSFLSLSPSPSLSLSPSPPPSLSLSHAFSSLSRYPSLFLALPDWLCFFVLQVSSVLWQFAWLDIRQLICRVQWSSEQQWNGDVIMFSIIISDIGKFCEIIYHYWLYYIIEFFCFE